jgi:hypothetical protein
VEARSLTTPAPCPVQRAVLARLAALDHAGVRWCLLRGATELDHLGDDVDLLVHGGDLRTLRRVMAAGEEATELQAWGHGSHHFFVSYVEEAGAWLKLDVVTELAFGPFGELPSRTAAALLGRTVRQGVLARPAPADAFWALLGHVVLDRGRIRPERGRELAALAGAARGEASPVGAVIARACPPGWDTERIIDAAASGRHDELLALGPALRARWPGGGRVRAAARAWLRRGVRRIDRQRPRRPGPIVALVAGAPHDRLMLGAALVAAWPERAQVVADNRRVAAALLRRRGQLVVLDAPAGGLTAARADVRVRLSYWRDPDELRRAALLGAWRRRTAQHNGLMTSNSARRSAG